MQTAGPIIDKLDRYNFYINHRLFREATRSINGKIVKVRISIGHLPDLTLT
jgi:TFIIF-interacting CTD phosphatase-like protein